MASLIQAVSAYRPRVATNRVVDLDELATRLARGSLVTPSIARMVLADLADELMYFLRTGASVRIPGIGVFRPELRMDGEMHTVVRLDPKLRRNLKRVSDFAGEVEGREVIGLDLDSLKARWDAEHPDDLLVLPARRLQVVGGVPGAAPLLTAGATAEVARGAADVVAAANGLPVAARTVAPVGPNEMPTAAPKGRGKSAHAGGAHGAGEGDHGDGGVAAVHGDGDGDRAGAGVGAGEA